MNKQNNFSIQLVVVGMLFLSLGLQSCTALIKPAYNPLSEENEHEQKVVNGANQLQPSLLLTACSSEAIAKIKASSFSASSGETVKFFQEADIWQAKVTNPWQVAATEVLPVCCEQQRELTFILNSLSQQGTKLHKHYIHIVNSDLGGKCVLVGALALKGGMNSRELIASETKTILKPWPSTAQELDKSAQEWLEEGNDFFDLGQYEDAISCYNQVLDLDVNCMQYLHIWAYCNKGNALYNLKQQESAILCYDEAISIDPKCSRAYYNKGDALYALGHKIDALACYDEALVINPDDAAVYCSKGNALADIGQEESALECFNKSIDLKPNDAYVYLSKGACLAQLDRQEEAIECYNSALGLKPNDEDVYFSKGVALAKINQEEKAMACYHKVLEINPNHASAYVNIGILWLSLAQQAALECYDKALEINPRFAEAYFNKALVLAQLGEPKAARQCFNNAIRIKPKLGPWFIM